VQLATRVTLALPVLPPQQDPEVPVALVLRLAQAPELAPVVQVVGHLQPGPVTRVVVAQVTTSEGRCEGRAVLEMLINDCGGFLCGKVQTHNGGAISFCSWLCVRWIYYFSCFGPPLFFQCGGGFFLFFSSLISQGFISPVYTMPSMVEMIMT